MQKKTVTRERTRSHRSKLWRWNLSLRRAARGFRAAVAAREFLYATCGIDELLFSGKKRMARRANTDFDILACGTGVINLAARAANGRLDVVGMNICFHGFKKDVKSSLLR